MKVNRRSIICGAAVLTSGAVFAQTNTQAVFPSGNNDTLAVSRSLLPPPAVSAINGKVDYAGGDMNSAEGHNFSASITLPVGHNFGFQADSHYSRISDLNFYGGAGHFFWRNPDIGLLGITGGYLYRDGFNDINTYQAGSEGELYWHRFTFGWFAGVGSINYQYSAPFIDTNPSRFVGRVSACYYPIDNLRVGASLTTAFKDNLEKGEIEYQTPINGVALTGEAGWGTDGYKQWLFGLRYYFGGSKSLRDRQRQDDPPGLMPQVLQSIGVYGAEYNKKGSAYVASQSGSGSPISFGLGVYGNSTLTGAPPRPPHDGPITVTPIRFGN